jgi:SsrA-binding protein
MEVIMATKKKASAPKTISNKRARFDCELGDGLLVGIALTGAETKALRRGHGHLRGAYVTVKDDELWLLNATITGDGSIHIPENEQTRTRKLLAKRREIDELIAAKQQGRTILPLEILTRGRFIKLRIAAGRGKRKFDKRQVLKKRDEERDVRAALKRAG